MSKYYQIYARIAQVQDQIRVVSGAGSQAIRNGGLAFLIGISLGVLAKTQGWNETLAFIFFSAGALGGLAVFVGLTQRLLGRAKARKLQATVQEVQQGLVPVEQGRADLLTHIRGGDFSVLPVFADFVFQTQPIDLTPAPTTLRFQPQRSEVCFVQIAEVGLGRLKSQTVTRKVGGGYRVGSVYVPVQKERVRTIGMDVLEVGTLALTNHRLLFLGPTRKLLIKWDKILELAAYRDSLAVTKDGRQSADYFLYVDGELLAAVIDGIGRLQR